MFSRSRGHVLKELLSNRHMGTVGLGDSLKRFGNWLTERGQKTAPEADFTATGSFSGDLLEVLKKPESYLLKAMQTFASQNPLVRYAFEARDIGIAIGTAIETSLKFESIIAGQNLTINDLKKMEKAIVEYKIGRNADLRTKTYKELGIAMRLAELSSNENNLVAEAPKIFMNNIKRAIKTYVAGKVTGLIGGTLKNKLFPGATGLLNYPKTYDEWLKDFGRTAMSEIQKKVEAVVAMKI
jgi:hypothetical protein